MNRLMRVLCRLETLERTTATEGSNHRLDARSRTVVTLLFLVSLLSLPIDNLQDIIPFFAFPILVSSLGGVSYLGIFSRSMLALPFVVFIGVFNLLYDRQLLWELGPIHVTRGLIGFLSIVVRGVLAVQGVLVLVATTGFRPICEGLQRMRVPALLCVQLLLVYRYLFVLLREALRLMLAREARSFGQRRAPLGTWGQMVGGLLLRTFDRAERIHCAMLSRGFAGSLLSAGQTMHRWTLRDTLFLVAWSVVFFVLRFFHPIERLSTLIY